MSRRPILSHSASAPTLSTSSASLVPRSSNPSRIPLGTPLSSLIGDEKRKYEKRIQAAIECHKLLQEWPDLSSMYKFAGKIGEGSFSVVYKAIDLRHNSVQPVVGFQSNLVAIKHVFGNASANRILCEVKLLADLRGHPNVASLVDIHRFNHHLVLVMPYWEHPQFLEYFRDLPISELRFYFASLTAALEFCHSKGIIHRDVKPNNYIYNPARRHGVLVDFGLAQHYHPPPKKPSTRTATSFSEMYLDPTSTYNPVSSVSTIPELALGPDQPAQLLNDKRPTMDANRAGTRGFRAPEVLFKVVHQTPVVDMWSMGVTLLCFLTRRFPFFPSDNDTGALQEIAVIFGARQMKRLARLFDRVLLTTLPTIPNEGVSLRDLIYTLNPTEFDTIPQEAFDFLKATLILNPLERITAKRAAQHPWLYDISTNGNDGSRYSMSGDNRRQLGNHHGNLLPPHGILVTR